MSEGWLDGVYDDADEEELAAHRPAPPEPQDVDQEDAEEQDAEPEPEPEPVDEADEIEYPAERDDGKSEGLTPDGEYRFLPVVGYMSGHVAAKTPDNDPLIVGGKYLTWWEEQSITPQYPYLLINPVGMSTLAGNEHHYSDALRLDKGDQFVLCDSGGYQMSTRDEGEIVNSPGEHSFKNVKLYPERIVDWQVRNADAGVILDVPPNLVEEGTKLPSNKKLDYEEWVNTVFDPHLEQSLDNARRMSGRLEELREEGTPGAEDFKQLGVIHGRTSRGDDPWALLERYHESMKDEMVDYDGWALSPQPPHSLGQMALHMAYAANRCQDVDYIHVLQGGGNTQRALLDYFAMLSGFFVTSDSSTHIRGSQWRQFYIPGTWNSEVIKITDRDENPLDRYPCACPVCTIAEEELGIEWLTEGSDGERGEIMCMHNLYQTQTSAKAISALLRKYGRDVTEGLEVNGKNVKVKEEQVGNEDDAKEKNQFWMMMTNRYSNRHIINLWNSMKFLRTAVEDGLEATQDEGWYIPWDSGSTGDELHISREADATDW